MPNSIRRCHWVGEDPLYLAHHDHEWGFPVADDRRLFEKICLEGFQAGLRWRTILGNARRSVKHFSDSISSEWRASARVTSRGYCAIPGIVRHRGKIESTINNAKRARELAEESGSLAAYFWRYEPNGKARPKRLTREALAAMSTLSESIALSKDLKKRGWTYVAPTPPTPSCKRWGLSTITCTNARGSRFEALTHARRLRRACRWWRTSDFPSE